MRVCGVAPQTACVFACCILLSACSVSQVKEGGKQLGASAFEQLFVLALFGPDALQRRKEEEYREWYWKTTPYRSSFTRDEFIDLQDRMEFEHFYEELRSRERRDSLDSERLNELRPNITDLETDVEAGGDATTSETDTW